ncbi:MULTISPECIES: hypothetical protein [Rhodococcus]|uniref:Uncharacterized protein n=1 Tax=Rhodococcus oxybenzonivorans TaxID=1990687 RepID=A0AAE5A8W3_9NOCA|nr:MULTISPECIES: hypothetical protein [Rhodococcus]MDV7243715.1 hypothetical protein [Rhodococcus oxybenzonivorans]MDV7267189.1 hypothetical protein [Rhodococcus oxybenzonivorans]MDV7275043.1 hypothetical protein [Rhodococcus oxybenzonivorans]MDV7335281.1 hypothetical protein [Rhodococcus oxybenzonivorans]MDV7345992.1 hypothetical protein [Rhodococcus oxybenzonivorans]
MTTVSRIEVARARRSRLVLFVGNPTSYLEVTQWATLRQWVTAHGLTPMRDLNGNVLCVIATVDVIEGVGSAKDSAMMQRAQEAGIPCVGVHETSRIWELTARARARSDQAVDGPLAHKRHEGA